MVNPLFSIIIPTYNSASTLIQCISSIINQAFANLEVLVIDGGSSDETLNILKGFTLQDDRIKWLSEKDKGIYDAMNKGISKAKGEWLYFLGSDDKLFNENVLMNIYNNISYENQGFDLVYGNVFSPVLGPCYDGEFNRKKILDKNICHQAIFYNKRVFNRIGSYNIKYKLLADYEFNLRCFLNNSIKSKYVNLVIAYFAEGGESSVKQDEIFLKDRYAIVKEFGYKTLPLIELKKNCSSNIEFIFVFLKRILK